MGIIIILLIYIVGMLGVVYLGYLLAYKQKFELMAGDYINKMPYPFEIKKKIARNYGLNIMAMGAICIIAIFVPKYTAELITFACIVPIPIMLIGKDLIIKKYKKSQKDNDETELK